MLIYLLCLIDLTDFIIINYDPQLEKSFDVNSIFLLYLFLTIYCSFK